MTIITEMLSIFSILKIGFVKFVVNDHSIYL